MLLRNLTVHLGFTKRSLAATAVPSQNHPQRIACRFPSSYLLHVLPPPSPTSRRRCNSLRRHDQSRGVIGTLPGCIARRSATGKWLEETYADDVKVPFCTHLPGGANRQPRRLLSRLRRPLLLLLLLLLRKQESSAPTTK